jgi:hypothetical protein
LPEPVSTSIPSTKRFAISSLLRDRFGYRQPNANDLHVSVF